jgi:hypothetical protein
MPGFGKSGGGGRRSDHRKRTLLTAVVTTPYGSATAEVVDVSSRGVRLQGARLPSQGQELLVSIESVRAFGRVAWTLDQTCGIAFGEPLSHDELERLYERAPFLRNFGSR